MFSAAAPLKRTTAMASAPSPGEPRGTRVMSSQGLEPCARWSYCCGNVTPMNLRLILPAFVLATACGAAPDASTDGDLVSEHGDFTLTLTHETGEFRRGTNDFSIVVHDRSGGGATLSLVRAQMLSHPHDPTFGEITPEGDGWRVHDLPLTMPGRWDITLRVTRDGRSDDALVITHVL